MKKRLISMVTLLAMLITLIPTGIVVSAVDADPIVFTKTLIEADASVAGLPDRIKLEAYTTGSTASSEQTVPTDIVMVLDQSGSMDDTVNGQTKLSMMKTAVTSFVTEVANINQSTGSDHRVAIVGFASESGNGNNTEILSAYATQTVQNITYNLVDIDALKTTNTYYISRTNGYVSIKYYDANVFSSAGWYTTAWYGRDEQINVQSTNVYERVVTTNEEPVTDPGIAYSDLTNDDYAAALVECTTDAIAADGTIGKAINLLDGNGATRTDLGIGMAQNIFAAQPEGTYPARNRIVMMLTDGVPTTQSSFSTTVANDTVSIAKALKTEGVNIFSTYLGTPSADSASFLQAVSSNYPNATAYNELGTKAAESYYKAHADTTGISSFFGDIVYTITANSALNETSVVTDTISEYFKLPTALPDGTYNPAQITTYTVEKEAGEGNWADDEVPFTAANVTIENDKTIKVTGFDFAYHCVTETAKDGEGGTNYGRKLVIYIPIAEDTSKVNFGGYLPTNDGAGIYVNSTATNPEITADTQYSEITLKYVLNHAVHNRHIGEAYTYNFDFDTQLNAFLAQMISEDYIPNGINNAGVSMKYRLIDTQATDGERGDDVTIATLDVPDASGSKNVDPTDFSNWTLEDGITAENIIEIEEGKTSANKVYALECVLTSENPSDDKATLAVYSILAVNIVREDSALPTTHIVGGIIDTGGTITADPDDKGVILDGVGYREEVEEGQPSANMIFTLKDGYEFARIIKKTNVFNEETQEYEPVEEELYNVATDTPIGDTYEYQFDSVTGASTIEAYTRLKTYTLTTDRDTHSAIREGGTYTHNADNLLPVYFAAHDGYTINDIEINGEVYNAEELIIYWTQFGNMAFGLSGCTIDLDIAKDGEDNDVIIGGDVYVPRTQDNDVKVWSTERLYKVTYNYYKQSGSTYSPYGEPDVRILPYGSPVTDTNPDTLFPEKAIGTKEELEPELEPDVNYTLKGWFATYTGTEFTDITDITQKTVGAGNLEFHAFWEKNADKYLGFELIEKQLLDTKGNPVTAEEDLIFDLVAVFHEQPISVETDEYGNPCEDIFVAAGETGGFGFLAVMLTDFQYESWKAGDPISVYEVNKNDLKWVYDDEVYKIYYEGPDDYDINIKNSAGEDLPADEEGWQIMTFRNSQIPYLVNYDLNGGIIEGNLSRAPKIVEYNDAGLLPKDADSNIQNPTKSGYRFTGWKMDTTSVDDTTTYSSLAGATNVTSITLVAQYVRNSGGGGGGGSATKYTLTYESNGGTEFESERYNSGATATLDKKPKKDGYIFDGWHLDKECTEDAAEVKMTSDKTVYANWIKDNGSAGNGHSTPSDLNGDNHFAYVIGYPDDTVRPDSNITRAEVTAIFFRLLKQEVRDANLAYENGFDDITDEMWYNTAVSTMQKLGIVKGTADTIFDAENFITRAEFAAICARFDDSEFTIEDNFSDVLGHWAEAEIHEAAAHGWIKGYEDNTFRPDQTITRAEAMTMINRVLNRVPETEDDLLDTMIKWKDNSDVDAWYYLAVQEATNSHNFEMKNNIYEKWTKLNQNTDWEAYQ